MGRRIVIEAGGVLAEAELNESRAAAALWKVLPLQAQAARWGGEVYFPVPVALGLEDGRAVVEAGDLGYWPPGKAFCIFFGPTPESRGEEIRPASPVTVVGRLRGDPAAFGRVRDGEPVCLARREGRED